MDINKECSQCVQQTIFCLLCFLCFLFLSVFRSFITIFLSWPPGLWRLVFIATSFLLLCFPVKDFNYVLLQLPRGWIFKCKVAINWGKLTSQYGDLYLYVLCYVALYPWDSWFWYWKEIPVFLEVRSFSSKL